MGQIKPLDETPSTKQNIGFMQIYTKNMKIPNPRATIFKLVTIYEYNS